MRVVFPRATDCVSAIVLSGRSPDKQIHNLIVGCNRIALQAAANRCEQSHAFAPAIVTSRLQGEAREIGRRLIELVTSKSSQLTYNDEIACLLPDRAAFDRFQTLARANKRYCLLLGGETTVVMKDQPGKGGRCQELALAAALALSEANENVSVLLLAAGSDGIDGPTDAAGAFAFHGMLTDHDDVQRARAALDRHDAYTFLSGSHGGENLLITGHTNTNVMDIVIVLVENKDT